MDGLRELVLLELSPLHQNNVLHGLIQLTNHLRSLGPPYHPTILDLCCLVRTLWQLRSLTGEQLWRADFTSQGIHCIREAKTAMEGLFGELNKKVADEGIVTQRTHSALWALNRFLAMTRYLVAPQEHVLNMGNGLLVRQRRGQDRYKLDSGCEYEDENAVLYEVWVNRNVGIFEHIGLKSGGAEYYDPMFWSRCPSRATEFFTVGRVFMMLWDVNALGRDLQQIADDDPTVHANRRALMTIESAYSGPYTGPGTVRRFVVVAQGVRSSYCLPITSFNDRGCSQQRDQQNYGVIFTGERRQTAEFVGSIGMIHPAIYITPMAPKPWPHEVLLKTDMPPAPPESELPSLELPAQCRIDYRRLCEVEHNVCSRNIGMVSKESLYILEEYAAFIGLKPRCSSSGNSDGMDLT